jgi:hypothetical protein
MTPIHVNEAKKLLKIVGHDEGQVFSVGRETIAGHRVRQGGVATNVELKDDNGLKDGEGEAKDERGDEERREEGGSGGGRVKDGRVEVGAFPRRLRRHVRGGRLSIVSSTR